MPFGVSQTVLPSKADVDFQSPVFGLTDEKLASLDEVGHRITFWYNYFLSFLSAIIFSRQSEPSSFLHISPATEKTQSISLYSDSTDAN